MADCQNGLTSRIFRVFSSGFLGKTTLIHNCMILLEQEDWVHHQGETLKWYYDQKVTFPFLLYFESVYFRYLPCLILSHEFDEKSDF